MASQDQGWSGGQRLVVVAVVAGGGLGAGWLAWWAARRYVMGPPAGFAPLPKGSLQALVSQGPAPARAAASPLEENHPDPPPPRAAPPPPAEGGDAMAPAPGGTATAPRPVSSTGAVVLTKLVGGGKWVNQYNKLHRLGSGAFGNVNLYRCMRTREEVAIKSLSKTFLGRRSKLSAMPSLLDSVSLGVEAMKRVSHPRVLQTIEVIDDPTHDKLYIVMEAAEPLAARYVLPPPGDLPAAVAGQGPAAAGGAGSADTCAAARVPEGACRALVRDLLEGLAYLHASDVVHGDIKPTNLLLGRDGRIKIGDLTCSRWVGAGGGRGAMSRSPATLAYAPPEALGGGSYGGMEADAWAAGVTAYQLLTGRFPFSFPEGGGDEVLKAIGAAVPLPRPEEVSERAWGLVAGLLEPDPARRLTARDALTHQWLVSGTGA